MAHYAGGLHNSMQGVCTVLCRTSAQAYAGCLHRHLPFEFVQLVHLYAADIAIDVNHDAMATAVSAAEMAMENREKK